MSKETFSNLSERDLLVKLTTEVCAIKEDIKDLGTKLDGSQKERADLYTRVGVLDQQVKENTKLRDWFVYSFIGHLVEGAAIAILAIYK